MIGLRTFEMPGIGFLSLNASTRNEYFEKWKRIHLSSTVTALGLNL
jgi:hypothetical protein